MAGPACMILFGFRFFSRMCLRTCSGLGWLLLMGRRRLGTIIDTHMSGRQRVGGRDALLSVNRDSRLGGFIYSQTKRLHPCWMALRSSTSATPLTAAAAAFTISLMASVRSAFSYVRYKWCQSEVRRPRGWLVCLTRGATRPRDRRSCTLQFGLGILTGSQLGRHWQLASILSDISVTSGLV